MATISAKDFAWAIVTLDFEKVEAAIAAGFDVNQRIPDRRPIVESAQTSENERMLKLLWAAGAEATTPFLEEVWAGFEQNPDGPNPALKSTDEVNQGELPVFDGKLKLSDLTPSGGTWSRDVDGISLHLPFAPFTRNGEVVQTAIDADMIPLDGDVDTWVGNTFTFPDDPEENLIDASMLLDHAHNPVDVLGLSFERKGDELVVSIRGKVDFEFEGADGESGEHRWEFAIEAAE